MNKILRLGRESRIHLSENTERNANNSLKKKITLENASHSCMFATTQG